MYSANSIPIKKKFIFRMNSQIVSYVLHKYCSHDKVFFFWVNQYKVFNIVDIMISIWLESVF